MFTNNIEEIDTLSEKLLIISSKALKRLSGKTQVVTKINLHNAHVRDRLTHSLEVASAAVYIHDKLPIRIKEIIDSSRLFNVCLLHDIGHPSFGHSGVEVLNDFSIKYGFLFEDNANTLVVVEKEMKNVSLLTKLSLIKYPYLLSKDYIKGKKGLYSSQYNKYYKQLQEAIKKQSLNPFIKRKVTYECELMNISDEISYLCSDMQDSITYFGAEYDKETLDYLYDKYKLSKDFLYKDLISLDKYNVKSFSIFLRKAWCESITFDFEKNKFSYMEHNFKKITKILRKLNEKFYIQTEGTDSDNRFINEYREYISYLIENINNEELIKKNISSSSYLKKYLQEKNEIKKIKILINSLAETTDNFIYAKIKERRKNQQTIISSQP